MVRSVAGRHDQARRTKLKYFRKETDSKDEIPPILRERVRNNLPTMLKVDYGVDGDISYNHFVVCVDQTSQGHFVMNDPEQPRYCGLCDDNIIEKGKMGTISCS